MPGEVTDLRPVGLPGDDAARTVEQTVATGRHDHLPVARVFARDHPTMMIGQRGCGHRCGIVGQGGRADRGGNEGQDGGKSQCDEVSNGTAACGHGDA